MIGHVLRRLGIPPKERGSIDAFTCPDIFELPDGRIAVIGEDPNCELVLPPDGAIGDHERIVIIPRNVFLAAAKDCLR